MRVLYVTGHYPPDFVSGATLLVARLAEQTAARGHVVQVLSGAIADAALADGERRTEVRNGVTVHWIGTAARIDQGVDANWINGPATMAAAEVVESFRPDVVHGHALQTLGAAMFPAADAAGAATVVTMHDFWWWCSRLFLVDRDLRVCPVAGGDDQCACAVDDAWRRSRRAALAEHLAAVDLVLVPSAAMHAAVTALGLDPTRVEIDENDVDLVPAPRPPADAAGPVRFLYVGGDSPLKGRDVMVAAAERLAAVPGWTLTLHGATAPTRPRRWRRRPRLDDRTRFRPPYPRAEAAGVFAAADVLVLPSIARESSSIAAREALAAGLAVITSDCLGPLEVVRDGENGLVVPTGDADALAAAMAGLAGDRTRLDRLRPDPQRATSFRTPAEHAAALAARYERLLGERARRDRGPSAPGGPDGAR